MQEHLQCLQLWRLVSQIWVEHFNCGIIGLRKAEKIQWRCQVARARQYLMKSLKKEVKKMILDNRQIIIREIDDDVGILFGLYQAILTDVLGIIHKAVKIVPRLQNFKQKQCRMDIA